MTELKLQELSSELSTLRETGEVLHCSRQKVWLWWKGVAHFNNAELVVLEQFLAKKLSEHVAKLDRLARP